MVHVSFVDFCFKTRRVPNFSGLVNWYKVREINFEDEKEYVANSYASYFQSP